MFSCSSIRQVFRQFWLYSLCDRGLCGCLWACGVIILSAGMAEPAVCGDIYAERVQPYLQKYCVDCHNAEEARGELDLTAFRSPADVINQFRRWNTIVEFVQAAEMPPREAPQPTLEESAALSAAVQEILTAEARKRAGDPGVVLPRRLSNTEYDLSIRELTGVDIRPTQDFPADPAGGEGFDNTGESLGMSPNLLKKYLGATQLVADHMVLRTTGLSFAPFPVTSYNERRKLTEGAIIRFYEQHAVTIRDYVEAAWRYRYRPTDQQAWSLDAFAAERGLSDRYLNAVWTFLAELESLPGTPREFREGWASLPAPDAAGGTPRALAEFCDLVEAYRRELTVPEGELIRANAGNWPIQHLDFRAKTAAARDTFERMHFRPSGLLRTGAIPAAPADRADEGWKISVRVEAAFGADPARVVLKKPVFSRAENLPRNEDEERQQDVVTLLSVLQASQPDVAAASGFGQHPEGGELPAESVVLQTPVELTFVLRGEQRQQLQGRRLLLPVELEAGSLSTGSVRVTVWSGQETAEVSGGSATVLMSSDGATVERLATFGTRFCGVFPNRFFYVDSGRGLAAGFHLVEGFFRDDQPLARSVLTQADAAELDQLWEELEFVTQSAETLLRGFVWFERSEREVLHDRRFDFVNADDPQLIQDDMLARFERVYLEKLGVRLRGETLEPEVPDDRQRMVHQFFEDIRAGLRRQAELLAAAEQRALSDVRVFARRAWRRSLTTDDAHTLQALYTRLRSDGQDVEQALRGVLVGILMSPEFCYLYREAPEGTGAAPLTSEDLATRLSYFLWSTVPDEELLRAGAEGELESPERLVQQSRRMLDDPRISVFAREFFGQWLRYRDYPVRDPINAEAFAGYDESLRNAIFEEPTRLITDLIRRDGSVTELLTSDRTFLNARLAAHYGGTLQAGYQQAIREQAALLGQVAAGETSNGDLWLPVSGLRQAGRGGLFGMALILTKNSAGERTSPVKRGFWTIHHLLGQHFPPPPADVPELPKSEQQADRTIRELLAAHVADSQCALCHRHFDSAGLAMEGFDAIGRSRTQDSAGRPVDTLALMPDGRQAQGVSGLMEYVEQRRKADFIRTLCRRFLGYALGRSVILSDQPLLDEMQLALEQNGYRFSVLFETVVRSPQFRTQRARDFTALQ